MSKAFKCLLCGRIITGGPDHAKCYVKGCPLTSIDQSNLVPIPEPESIRIPEGNLGRYDDDVEEMVKKHKATAVLLVVLEGDKGDGLSVSITDPRLLDLIPSILRHVADDIEERSKARWRKKE
jgi:hypothetical protein